MRFLEFELSAECYRVRLLLGMLGLPYDTVPVDVVPGREQHSAWVRAISPDGILPVLETDGWTAIGDRAILLRLATGDWLGPSPEREQWLDFAEALSRSSGAARWIVATAEGDGLAGHRAEAHRLLRRLDEHLWFAERGGQPYLIAGPHPTIADLSVFAETVLCEEGGVSRQDYPAIRRWLDRIKRIPGFVTMSGVFPAGPA